MATKDKKAARDAIDDLRHWLQRDQHGTKLLGIVEKFVSLVRQEKASALDELASVKEKSNSIRSQLDLASRESLNAKETISQLEGKLRAANHQAAAFEAELQKLKEQEKKNIDDKFEEAPSRTGDALALERLAKRFASINRNLRAPKYSLVTLMGLKKQMMFDIREWINDYTDDEFLRLGMMTTLLCLLPLKGPCVVAFVRRQDDVIASKRYLDSDSYMRWWMNQGWVQITEADMAASIIGAEQEIKSKMMQRASQIRE